MWPHISESRHLNVLYHFGVFSKVCTLLRLIPSLEKMDKADMIKNS